MTLPFADLREHVPTLLRPAAEEPGDDRAALAEPSAAEPVARPLAPDAARSGPGGW